MGSTLLLSAINRSKPPLYCIIKCNFLSLHFTVYSFCCNSKHCKGIAHKAAVTLFSFVFEINQNFMKTNFNDVGIDSANEQSVSDYRLGFNFTQHGLREFWEQGDTSYNNYSNRLIRFLLVSGKNITANKSSCVKTFFNVLK